MKQFEQKKMTFWNVFSVFKQNIFRWLYQNDATFLDFCLYYYWNYENLSLKFYHNLTWISTGFSDAAISSFSFIASSFLCWSSSFCFSSIFSICSKSIDVGGGFLLSLKFIRLFSVVNFSVSASKLLTWWNKIEINTYNNNFYWIMEFNILWKSIFGSHR